ncbi:DUF58 domain-containing protein [Pseudomonas stutzeri]|uniref:DUF58 domain-containing protein n=1 Tax=Stutzerimonas stutzeri TaxID=316 RepID=A0A2N8S215_STUST|nr:DUF58 domain-containing protein [Stutzerimonas stutzeri]MCQ4295819.1 DUF58 domain-containing protein [Stutzerimonas stutzeri]PNF80654.1 DUF58 domain-containing protein [Stutzerimonas stutzeri]
MTPSRRLLVALATLVLLAVPLGALTAMGIEAEGWRSAWWGLLLALGMVAVLDARNLKRRPSPSLQRSLSGNLPLGHWSNVQLLVRNEDTHPAELELFDHVPEGMLFEQLPQRIRLQPWEHCQITYRLRPVRRGRFAFQRCDMQLTSPLGLWRSKRQLPLADDTRVYPDFARLHGAGLQAVDVWLNRLGVRQQPRRGLGLEFHQLREFREGDTLRQIDWKATARTRMPIAREYQDEQDQQIVLMLDCGRRMRSQDAELTHFDHALNAGLLLAYAALRQGDAVGVCTFAGEPRYVAPAKGQQQLRVLLNSLYDLQPTQQPADYGAATEQLLARQQRQALVIVLSNLRDEDDAELHAALQRLSRRHRVLLVSLREEVLDHLRVRPVQNLDDALDYCGAQDYLSARQQLHKRLMANGMPVLDVPPCDLGPALVGRYLAWKKTRTL